MLENAFYIKFYDLVYLINNSYYVGYDIIKYLHT